MNKKDLLPGKKSVRRGIFSSSDRTRTIQGGESENRAEFFTVLNSARTERRGSGGLFRLACAALAVMLTLSVFSCAADKADVLESAEKLIERSELLNEVYYGSGIPYDTNRSIGNYYYAEPEYLEAAGFSNLDELVRLTREVFSSAYSNLLENTVLSGITTESGVVYARYANSDTKNEEGDAETGEILIYANYTPLLSGTRSYNYDTLKVTKASGKGATLTIEVTVTDEDGNAGEPQEIDIKLVREKSGWRIDSPTY